MNVLIVDDNKNTRMLIRLLLEDFLDNNPDRSLDIHEAEDGLVAIEKCQNQKFDLVLMDVKMPNMDGIEATKNIHLEHPNIIILGVSSLDDGERKKLMLEYGAQDFLSKPINQELFLDKIMSCFKS